MHNITESELKKFEERGYGEDMLPKQASKRTWSTYNYFTLWQGSVHNVPSYIMVGGFLSYGLSNASVMLAIILSGLIIAGFLVLNGTSGTKYGIPFSMILRASYGIKGALFPGILRGGIAAIMWFGLQNFLGSTALYIIIVKIWPGFETLGADATFGGISYGKWLAFMLFTLANIAIGFGGGNAIKKFTAILNPCIYVVFGGMAIWAIRVAGFSNILNYRPAETIELTSGSSLFIFLFILNSLVAVWAAPIVSASDFTQNAKSSSAQAMGQFLGLGVAYTVFSFSSICILAGASVYYKTDTWDILVIIEKWDGTFLSILAATIITMTTISTNATGNIVPAAYQIISMFRKLTYKQGVLIASVISILILPWKLVENKDSIYGFLEIIGGMLGPVTGVMLSHYFVTMRTKINLEDLYTGPKHYQYYKGGFNINAFLVTVIAIFVSLGGKFIPIMKPLAEISFFVGVITAFALYSLLTIFMSKRPEEKM